MQLFSNIYNFVEFTIFVACCKPDESKLLRSPKLQAALPERHKSSSGKINSADLLIDNDVTNEDGGRVFLVLVESFTLRV